MRLVVCVLIFLILLLFIRTSAGSFRCMNLHDMTLGDKKKNLLLAKNFCIFIKHCFKRVKLVSRKKKTQRISDLNATKCEQNTEEKF